jgi:hypothetical protein
MDIQFFQQWSRRIEGKGMIVVTAGKDNVFEGCILKFSQGIIVLGSGFSGRVCFIEDITRYKEYIGIMFGNARIHEPMDKEVEVGFEATSVEFYAYMPVGSV